MRYMFARQMSGSVFHGMKKYHYNACSIIASINLLALHRMQIESHAFRSWASRPHQFINTWCTFCWFSSFPIEWAHFAYECNCWEIYYNSLIACVNIVISIFSSGKQILLNVVGWETIKFQTIYAKFSYPTKNTIYWQQNVGDMRKKNINADTEVTGDLSNFAENPSNYLKSNTIPPGYRMFDVVVGLVVLGWITILLCIGVWRPL